MKGGPCAVRGATGGVALAVFSDAADLPWLRILKPGFRHCFVVVRCDAHWVVHDPLSNRTEIAVLAGVRERDLAAWYRRRGFHVAACRLGTPPKRSAPVGLYTCVEAVKRILGIHARRVVTPWNLYKLLISEKNRK